MVLPPTFSLRLPVRFLLPCDLQLDTHEAGSVDAGREHTPRGAGPMFSNVLGSMISVIFTTVFTLRLKVDLVQNVAFCEINSVFVIFRVSVC
jgi:hypothetical protein